MAAALARLGLRAVKEVRVQFCPFEKNVESTRTFLQAVSSEKVRSTNFNCLVTADVRHDGSEPCVDVLFGGHAWGVRREGQQTARTPKAPLSLYLILSFLPQETDIA
ncbi:mitochondrial ribosomal protein L53 [Phyllostomus discolor]|uniref:Large ribosomal subunit protein mL53 n=1 Tax=Phyllostomus discolor TaxID=89673 RepID=A0A834A8A2_9CHIR|nr:mitochondrial ribosomal protein L53 [Phyllostomus discolor]